MSDTPKKEQKVLCLATTSSQITTEINHQIGLGWEVKQIASGERVVILFERNKS